MTCIVYGAKTKKELRALLASTPSKVSIEDPSIFAPRFLLASTMVVGQSEVVTNHPKRSWFAKITRKSERCWEVE